MNRRWTFCAVVAALAVSLALLPPSRSAVQPNEPPRRFDGTLSVLTYNVKGLPWPVASGRSAALEQIGQRLRAMRARGQAPAVVVLQEAFTAPAQAIAATAGYRYVATGAGPGDAHAIPLSGGDRAFADQAHWWAGETEGKFVGSGLQILSDYPIAAIHRIAFPAFACAGYDCLAAKGALMATLDVSGAPAPVDVITAHLNSRHASGVPDLRSNYAYRRQVEALTRFVRAAHDPSRPLIVAGDFNVGSSDTRFVSLMADAGRWDASSPVRDALRQYARQGGVLDADAAWSLRRARDWQFFLDGRDARLDVVGIATPFGRQAALSDHVGYAATYRLRGATPAEEAVTTPARPTLSASAAGAAYIVASR